MDTKSSRRIYQRTPTQSVEMIRLWAPETKKLGQIEGKR